MIASRCADPAVPACLCPAGLSATFPEDSFVSSRIAIARLMYAALALASACCGHARQRQFKPRPLNDPATGETITSRAPSVSGSRAPTCRSRASRWASSGSTIDFKKDLGPDRSAVSGAASRCCGRPKAQVPVSVIPIKYEQTHRHARRSSSTARGIASALPVNSTLDWKAYRFGYEYRLLVERIAGSAGSCSTRIHRRPRRRSTSSIVDEFAQRRGADSRHRRHRPRLRRPEHLDHRRGHRLQAAGNSDQRTTTRPLRRLRHLRHVNFTNNVGVAGRLPLVRPRLRRRTRHRVVQAEGDVLRGGRAVLNDVHTRTRGHCSADPGRVS